MYLNEATEVLDEHTWNSTASIMYTGAGKHKHCMKKEDLDQAWQDMAKPICALDAMVKSSCHPSKKLWHTIK